VVEKYLLTLSLWNDYNITSPKQKIMYTYEECKKEIFTEDGLVTFLAIRDNVKKLLKKSGAVMMSNAISGSDTSNTWTRLACVDHLVALAELREIKQNKDIRIQDRIFVLEKSMK